MEPLTIDEVKLHLRLNDDTTEDAWIADRIVAAREWCENYTGKALAWQTIELYGSGFPSGQGFRLPMAPIVSVTSVTYKDSAGTESTFTDYIADTVNGWVVPAYGKSWPSFTPYPVNPVKVTYVAGYDSAPQVVKQAMLLLIGHWYENREAVVIGTISTEIQFTVKALLSQYRDRWWD